MRGVAMTWMFLPFKRAMDFSGRSCRREYWMFMALKVICSALLAIGLVFTGAIASAPIFSGRTAAALLGNLTALAAVAAWLLIFLLPEIALTIRRWHDIGNSGWVIVVLMIWSLLPVVGFLAGIVHLVAMCWPGDKSSNQYGPNPAPKDATQGFAMGAA